MLSCDSFQPFVVLRFPFQFEGDPERVSKLFVIALNVVERELLVCFKPTSQTRYYDADPVRLKGVVEILPGLIDCFTERTLIPPDVFAVSYAYIRSCHRQGEFQVVGRLADDFREKMITAVTQNAVWRKKDKEKFFDWFR